MGYLLDHCRLEKLSERIIRQCRPFTCKNDPGIDSFFHLDAQDNFSDYECERMAVSHCLYSDDRSPKMVCAFSLSCTALRVDLLPRHARNRLNRKSRIPNNKRRAQYPAVLIGQLCVFEGFGKNVFPHDVGKEMMDLIKTMALEMDNSIASRFLIVDATNNPNVLDYYKRNGFFFVFESESEEIHCLHKETSERQLSHRFDCLFGRPNLPGPPPPKTRLMAFDLILLRTSDVTSPAP